MVRNIMTEHSQETKIAILEAKVDHMMGHVTELTKRVRAVEKVCAIVSAVGIAGGGIVGTTVLNPQKAEACSPPLDGSEFTCPPWDDVILERHVEVSIVEEDIPEYYNTKVTLYDTRVAHMGHDFPTWPTAGEMIQAVRDHESKKNRTSVEDSIGNALDELEWIEEE